MQQAPPSLPPTQPSALAADLEARDRDLGFGSVVARESRQRLLNRDGSFNVERHGLPSGSSLSLYHRLVTMTWPHFLLLVAASLLLTNVVFAACYVLLGRDSLSAPPEAGVNAPFLRAFFFSVQTFATIGYGQIAPMGIAANILVTVESYYSILYVALVTGLVFARFARPTARLLFSDRAIVAPYRDGHAALMLRLVNARRSQLLDLTARVIVAMWEYEDGRRMRRFRQLQLERPSVSFFPLSWTIVHPIDDASPFWGLDEAALADREPEILVLITGVDETFASVVHARTSYRGEEIRWGARFVDIYERTARDDDLAIDVRRLSETTAVELPTARPVVAPGAPR